MPSAGPWSPPPLGLYRKAWVCPTSSTEPLLRSTACMPRHFQNLKGTCTPPETLCPGSGHSLACLCQAWPRFSLQPRPHSSARGSRNRDLRWDQGPAVGAALLFLVVPATQGLQRQPLWEGQPVTVIANRCHPSCNPPNLQSTLDYGKVILGPWLYPSLPSGRAGETGLSGEPFLRGACSPTLCLGHFKVKFSSMNVQPVSKEKFLW